MQRSPYKYTQNTYDRDSLHHAVLLSFLMIRMRTNETQFAYRPNFRANLYIFSYRLAVNFILNWNLIIYFRND